MKRCAGLLAGAITLGLMLGGSTAVRAQATASDSEKAAVIAATGGSRFKVQGSRFRVRRSSGSLFPSPQPL